jgi:hypothetical protein
MFTADLLERAVKTWLQYFVVTFFGALTVPANVLDLPGWEAAGLAAGGAALAAAASAVTSLLSKPVGDRGSASIIPPQEPSTGVSGWTIEANGSAEFNDVTPPPTLDTSALVTLADQGPVTAAEIAAATITGEKIAATTITAGTITGVSPT